MSKQAGLVVEGLCKSFGGVRAVDDVGFTVPPQGMVAVIGPNGAGKTTCFHMLNGQLPADRGSVRLNGRELVGLAPRQVWKLGVARSFQIASIFRSMRVWENVAMVLISNGQHHNSFSPALLRAHRDTAYQMLERAGMAEVGEIQAALLSYGDVKRVELVLALASKPRLLLMDEPTAGMAPSERSALMDRVRGLMGDGALSVLFTEHDMDVVFGYADRILVLARGRVIARGTPDEIRDDRQVREVYLGGMQA